LGLVATLLTKSDKNKNDNKKVAGCRHAPYKKLFVSLLGKRLLSPLYFRARDIWDKNILAKEKRRFSQILKK